MPKSFGNNSFEFYPQYEEVNMNNDLPATTRTSPVTTNHNALIQCAGFVGWRKSGEKDSYGKFYGPGFFSKTPQFLKMLKNRSRKTTSRLAIRQNCYACGVPVNAAQSSGDHILSLADGGPDDATNFAPMCKSCNSSKNKTDLTEWWLKKGKNFLELDVDVLISYTRLKYQSLDQAGQLDLPAPPALLAMLKSFSQSLPTTQHTEAFTQIQEKSC